MPEAQVFLVRNDNVMKSYLSFAFCASVSRLLRKFGSCTLAAPLLYVIAGPLRSPRNIQITNPIAAIASNSDLYWWCTQNGVPLPFLAMEWLHGQFNSIEKNGCGILS